MSNFDCGEYSVIDNPNRSTAFRTAAIAAVATFAVSGCTPNSSHTPDAISSSTSSSSLPISTSESIPSISETPTPYDPFSVFAACKRPLEQFENEYKVPFARDCIREETKGSIALVDFGTMSDGRSKALAKSVRIMLGQASDSILTPTITVIQASPQAKAALATSIKLTHCTDGQDPGQFASTIALETMPEIRTFDIVEALNPNRSCGDEEGGVANTLNSNTADVFIPEFKPNYTTGLVQAATHEILHDFGLGHAGDVYFRTPNKSYTDIGSLCLLQTNCNLSQAIAKGYYYEEYGFYVPGSMESFNVMGDYGKGTAAPTPLQLNELMWPKAVLEHKRDVLAVPLTSKWGEVSANGHQKQPYFMANLLQPVTLKAASSKNSVKEKPADTTFDQVAFVPVYDAKEPNQVFGVDVYMANAGAQFAYAGFQTLLENKSKLSVGTNQVVNFSASGPKLLAKLTTR